MKPSVLIRLALLLTAILVISTAFQTQAASNLQVTLFGVTGYTITGNADTDDVGGSDYVCVVCRNSDNSLNDVDIWSFPVGNPINFSQGCNDQFGTGLVRTSAEVFDVAGPYSGRVDTPEGAAFCEAAVPPPPPPDPGQDPEPGQELVSMPTCIDSMPNPDWAAGGVFLTDSVIHWAPFEFASTPYMINANQSAFVLGVDESGEYSQIVWVCDLLWVRSDTLGPNYDYPWNGKPLPTEVVEYTLES